MLKILDLSDYQGDINFGAVKDAGYVGVILKTSEGRTWKAENFVKYYDGAKAVGLKISIYHFLRNNAPSTEVDNCLSVLSGRTIDFPIAIDTEVDLGQSKQQITGNIRQFYDILKTKGYESMLYTYKSFLQDYIDYSQLQDIKVWIAYYAEANPNVQNQIGWQYTDKGRVPGISGNVDMSYFDDSLLGGNFTTVINNNFLGVNTLGKMAWGEKSNRVRLLQGILNVLLGRNLKEDGDYGDQTKAAVEDYQRIMHISVDGEVWKETADTLYNDIKNGWFKIA